MRKIFTLLLLITSFVTIAQQNPTLPVDPNVRTGKLENGLTYYIRNNGLPENRADFYIAQKVGSMQEEDNQAGLAHFLEHMAFNGTKNFPGKSMLNYLQDNGIKFGTNINAYTSFDETVYYINNIPTTNQQLMDSALLVLHDWSNAIALEEEELENERGVIREEWRTRGGAQQRLWDQLLPKMYPGSKYAKRMPIGNIDVINNFKPEEIRAYYHKWYRPDMQGIIVVGNVNVDEMEQKIKALFSPITLDAERATREYFPVPDNKEPIVAVATDTEARNTSIMMFYKHDPMPEELKNTQAGYLTQYILSAASSMMNQRFAEMIQKPDAPFTSAYAYDGDYFVAKTKDAWTVVAGSAEEKIKEALAAMVRETERVKRYGFTPSEYEIARTNILKSYENAYNNRDKQRNSAYSQEYVRAFTDGEAIPGIEFEYRFMQSMTPNIPVEAINQTIKQLIGDENIVISVTGPQKEGLVYPAEEELLAVLDAVKAETIEPYAEQVIEEPLVTSPPTPGKITKEEKDAALDATVWTLQNGMKVILKNTDFKDDEIRMTGSSVGGYSQYAIQDPVNSKLMNAVMKLGGVGNFSATDLPKVLAGKTASASPGISLITQNFNGSSSIRDFETMLQLVYLYFTAPRKDNDAFQSYLQRMETQLRNQEAEPMVAFSDSITAALYGDNPLAVRIRVADLKQLDYDRIMEMYKQQFSNPGSFVFTFVGNIDEEKVRPVVEQYLASLPGQAVKGEFIRVPMNFKEGETNNIFKREMQNPKASVFNTFTGKVERNMKNQILMSMFDQILDIVYTEKVREEEGGTYGVSSAGAISRYPEGQTILQIMFDTDPEKMAHLNEIIYNVLKEIAANGPRETDFTKVKEYMNKSYNESLKENGYWLNVLDTRYFYGEDTYTNYIETVNAVTPGEIKEFAANLINQGNKKTIVMMPKVNE
ncbi:M16 family metallopeptidase [Proteiniphilum sp. UBA1028]|jgi:zinc protease|uniref:M16 family metallopeptidase n=1 Tax=Proteiniphilum sp. UBA1028 TaxID=1947251 RepID=UPI0025DA6FE1|nr:M16 family metallopeptidase [Proteiniphilum sp. UBA1028]